MLMAVLAPTTLESSAYARTTSASSRGYKGTELSTSCLPCSKATSVSSRSISASIEGSHERLPSLRQSKKDLNSPSLYL